MSVTATYVDADTFTVVGDQTAIFVYGRRIRCDCGVDGYKYGAVLTTSVSTDTTVNLMTDDDAITANLTAVDLSVVKPGNTGNSSAIIGPIGTPNTPYSEAVVIGREAGNTGDVAGCVLIGHEAGEGRRGAGNDVLIGYRTGRTGFSGNSYQNVAIGMESGPNGAGSNTRNFIGNTWAFNWASSSSENVIIGHLCHRRPGTQTVAIGAGVAESGNGTRSKCVFIGYKAAKSVTAVDEIVSIGYYAGYLATTGDYNTNIGAHAGYSNVTGLRNVCIGYKAGYNETGDDKLHIANTDTKSLISGDFSAETVEINGALDVLGGISANGNAGYTGDLNDSTSTKIADVVDGIITAVVF